MRLGKSLATSEFVEAFYALSLPTSFRATRKIFPCTYTYDSHTERSCMQLCYNLKSGRSWNLHPRISAMRGAPNVWLRLVRLWPNVPVELCRKLLLIGRN